LVATLSFSQFGIASSFLATDSGIFWYGQTSNTVTVGGYVNGSVVTYATYNAAAQSSPQTIAADTTNIYWTLNKGSTSGSNAVIACPVSGCPAGGPTILETGSTPMDITVAAGFLYWIDGTGPNQLMKCPIAGCGSTPTILGTNSTSNSWLLPIADSSNVYFAGNTGSNNSRLVLQCGVNGCPSSGPTELATSPNPYLAIDSTNVYWHTGNSVVSCGIGGCGGNPTTVFTNSSLPSTAPPIAVDATSIYWLNGASLMKIAK
jgi:hypothetical protein